MSGERDRASVRIVDVFDAPREVVFAAWTQPDRLKRGSGLGARYAQGVKGPGGRRIPADIEITEFEPGQSIAFQTLTGPVRPRGRYLLSPAEGGTRVRFDLDADVRGFKRLVTSMVQRTMDNEVSQLDRLKHIIEQG